MSTSASHTILSLCHWHRLVTITHPRPRITSCTLPRFCYEVHETALSDEFASSFSQHLASAGHICFVIIRSVSWRTRIACSDTYEWPTARNRHCVAQKFFPLQHVIFFAPTFLRHIRLFAFFFALRAASERSSLELSSDSTFYKEDRV